MVPQTAAITPIHAVHSSQALNEDMEEVLANGGSTL